MNWYKVAEFPAQTDLSEIHAHFNQRRLLHRFTENRGVQELWLADERSLNDAKAFIEAWQQGKIQLQTEPREPTPATRAANPNSGLRNAIRKYPITLVIILLGVLGYVIATPLRESGLMWNLTFQDFYPTAAGLMYEPGLQALWQGEYWRLLTPTFLHFNLLHIVFNGLWIWEFGRRLERYFSIRAYLLIFFVTALGANLVQYFTAFDAPFGGLSGVVYGYLGVLFVASRIAPSPILAVPPGVFGFMLVWLALGVFGVVDLFIPGPSAVGNGAHLGGLLFGLILGYLLLNKKTKPSS
jgi:GlpG protein